MEHATSLQQAETGHASRSHARWRDHGQQIQRGAHDFITAVDDLLADAERSLRAQVKGRPYVTLSAAAGCGFVLGGGLASRLTAAAVGMSSRLAIAVLAQVITAHLNNTLAERPTSRDTDSGLEAHR